ncbi:hypothetical protein Pyn_39279 [Prunus yedoensis var. nudiflora]|uniref:Uncharacterized protein n=1 Tax=Prunus yedoensis var. nudiflora TaxID=2094558 RepID=A0A314Y513_PRUYE|nr:hypothetical protein Pyn_39279 [Prunus yedoensis var. nudiflora]
MIHQEKDVARVAELQRVREETRKRDAQTKAMVDHGKKAAEESNKKRVEAVSRSSRPKWKKRNRLRRRRS